MKLSSVIILVAAAVLLAKCSGKVHKAKSSAQVKDSNHLYI